MLQTKQAFARYLPVNEQALLWELYCKDAGYTHIIPGSNYPPVPDKHPATYSRKVKTGRVLREFQVVYITAGSGWFRDSVNGKQEIKAGDIFIIFPGVEHSYSPNRETGWQEYWVGFDGEQARRLQRKGLFSPKRPVHHLGLDTSIMADFEQIIQLCRQQPPGFQVMLGIRILQLLAHIHITETSPQTRHNEKDIVQRAREIMEFNVDNGLDIKEIASELQVNYQYLLKLFKLQTGLTPYQYYLQLRIARAQQLISLTDLSVKEISALLHFDNQYYFSRIFKKKTGVPPSLWRTDIH